MRLHSVVPADHGFAVGHHCSMLVNWVTSEHNWTPAESRCGPRGRDGLMGSKLGCVQMSRWVRCSAWTHGLHGHEPASRNTVG